MKRLLLYGMLALFLIGIALGIVKVFSLPPPKVSPSMPAASAAATRAAAKKAWEKWGKRAAAASAAAARAAVTNKAAAKKAWEKEGKRAAAASPPIFEVPPFTRRTRKTGSGTRQQRQQGRVEVIQQLIEDGILYKVETGKITPIIWVAPGFYRMPIDGKRLIISVIADSFSRRAGGWVMVVLKDSRTGKRIGKFTSSGGLYLR